MLRIEHTTRFTYAGPVASSYNEARMEPVTNERQRVLEARLNVEPVSWTHRYLDYWGAAVTAFEVLAPHDGLVIRAESLVEVTDPEPDLPDATWDELDEPALRDELAEHLGGSDVTSAPPDLARLAGEVAEGRTPGEAAVALCAALRDEVEYVPGVTTVHTPAADAWAARTGVCQDMAHLAIAALRSIGIPARYVSGYLHHGSSQEIGVAVVGESHAWVEYWVGRWVGYDPTNRVPVGERHVVLARGREYADVAPLTGVYDGPGTSGLDVEVRITRVG